MLSPDDQRALFRLCREAIGAHLRGEAPPELPDAPGLQPVVGVFVTLRVRESGNLRGCIGHTLGRHPLAEGVRELAVAAAVRDRRFTPLTLEELDGLSIDLSVLSPLSPADPEAIEIGTHGLLIRLGERSGLLLPQVASDRDWSPKEFLAQTCVKAGLPRDAWQRPDAELSWFTSTCYAEADAA